LIVEISAHGSVLKRDHETFLIANENEKIEVPAEKVDAIVITANALISTQAVRLCIERNIQLVIADWAGRPVGRFWVSTAGKNTEIRRKQYLNQETSVAFDISLEVTATKLRRQRKLLIDLKHNRKSTNSDLEIAISSITASISKLSAIKFCDGWKETLLGVEGSSASAYFRAVSASLPPEWSFQQRSQYPAKDGFNAVLNYIYGMGYASVEKAIILSGLDPNAGFYHADSYGKPTLSFDIMELVRPLLDRTAISFFTKKVADKSWFEEQEKGEGIFLSKKARTTIIEAYSEKNRKAVEKEAWNYCKKIISMLCI
jgi:CRISPR-associated protein Cas1